VGSCEVFIAVIGRHWLVSSDEKGRRRLDNPADFVRIEIATALRRDIRVIPVLVEGAPVPEVDQLPEDLKALVRRNAVEVSHSRFNADFGRLVKAIERVLEKADAERKRREKELLEVEQREKDRLKTEQLEKERLEAQQREKDRLKTEQLEKERLEAQREKDRLKTEQLEKERLEAQQREKQRLEPEQWEKQRLEAQQREKDRVEAEQREREHLDAQRREKERPEAERWEKQRLAGQKRETERLQAEGHQREEEERTKAERLKLWQEATRRIQEGIQILEDEPNEHEEVVRPPEALKIKPKTLVLLALIPMLVAVVIPCGLVSSNINPLLALVMLIILIVAVLIVAGLTALYYQKKETEIASSVREELNRD
jgi:hypothetical protein